MSRVQLLSKKLREDIEAVERDNDLENDIQTLAAKYKYDIAEHGKHCTKFINNKTHKISAHGKHNS
jgi:hypothetical protein